MNNLPLQFVLLLGELFPVIVHVVLTQHQLDVLQLLTVRVPSQSNSIIWTSDIFTKAVNESSQISPGTVKVREGSLTAAIFT